MTERLTHHPGARIRLSVTRDLHPLRAGRRLAEARTAALP
jgi:hypothetical protein